MILCEFFVKNVDILTQMMVIIVITPIMFMLNTALIQWGRDIENIHPQ